MAISRATGATPATRIRLIAWLASITENIEDTLWSAIRGVEESIALLNNLGDHYAEKNQPKLAALYFQKAQEAKIRAELVRQTVFSHEQLTTASLNRQAAEEAAADNMA